MQTWVWVLALILIGFITYFLSYLRFRRMITKQAKMIVHVMKAEDDEINQYNNPYAVDDDDFVDLERAALTLRKKYLRLRRQSKEERKGYETVFSGLKEAIVTVDQNLRIISFNSSFLSSFKWTPHHERGNYLLHDVLRNPEVIAAFKKTIDTNEVEKTEIDTYQLFVTPLPSLNENETWYLGVFYDLTEIRKTEKIRVDFVANASHELRTPLTVIKGYTEVLDQRLNKPELREEKELLQPIVESVKNMSELMDDLLNLSKLDVGGKLIKSELSTQKITEDILSEVANIQQLSHKNISARYDVESILANEDSVKQILRNLIINAIKYSAETENIEVTWQKKSSHILLKVKDHGPGISKEHQARIFERFYRIDKGRGRDQGGSGLGLALVKNHVLNHGGKISLISDSGQGCEFICEFPNY